MDKRFSDGLKLFLAFFIVFTLFSHYVGWNELSRVSLSQSLVERNELNINQNVNYTGDRAYYNGNYYTDKAPGSSFVYAPFYLAYTSFFDLPTEYDNVLNTEVYFNETNEGQYFVEQTDMESYQVYDRDFDDGNNYELMMFLFLVVASALPGALLIVLIYKFSLLFVSRKSALLTSVIFGFGTILFQYSTTMPGPVITGLIAFTGFYLVTLSLIEDKNFFFISGFFIAFSTFFEYYAGIFSIAAVLSLGVTWVFKKFLHKFWEKELAGAVFKFKDGLVFLSGIIIGLIPLAAYNYFVFGGITQFSFFFSSDIFFSMTGLRPFSPVYIRYVLPRILFYPYRGLLFYSPLLIVSFIGIYKVFNKGLFVSSYILTSLAGFIVFNSVYRYWFAWASFGPRYLVVVIPILAILFAVFIDDTEKKFTKSLIVILVLISVFHSFLGLQMKEGMELDTTSEEYNEQIFSYEPFGNPIYEHYLPKTVERGITSELISGFFRGEYNFDKMMGLGNRHIFGMNLLNRVVSVNLVNLSLVIILIVFIPFINYKRFINLFDGFLAIKIGLGVFILLLVFFSIISIHSTEGFYFGEGWFQEEHFNSSLERVSRGESQIYFLSEDEKNGSIFMDVNYVENGTGSIYLNDEEVKEFELNSGERLGLYDVSFKEGVNEITVDSECRIPAIDSVEGDERCISFVLDSIGKVESDANIGKNKFFDGWNIRAGEEDSLNYSFGNSTILMNLEEGGPKGFSTKLYSFFGDLEVGVSVGGVFVGDFVVGEGGGVVSVPWLELDEGLVPVEFNASCSVVSEEVEGSEDDRCLSFRMEEFEKYSRDDYVFYDEGEKFLNRSELDEPVFFEGWYFDQVEGEELDYSVGDSSLLFYNEEPVDKKMEFLVDPFFGDLEVGVSVGGVFVGDFVVEEGGGVVSVPWLELDEGLVPVEFNASCGVVSEEVEGSTDDRCLSFILREYKYRDRDSIEFKEGFGEEKGEEEKRWMFEKGKFKSEFGEERISTFNFEHRSYQKDRRIELSFDGNNESTQLLSGTNFSQYYSPIILGRSFEADFEPDNCLVPKEVEEDSEDSRCLSIRLREVNLNSFISGENISDIYGSEKIYSGSKFEVVNLEDYSYFKMNLRNSLEKSMVISLTNHNGREVRKVVSELSEVYLPLEKGLNRYEVDVEPLIKLERDYPRSDIFVELGEAEVVK